VTISQSNSASGAPSEETSEPKGEIGGECACAACMNELEQITAERDAYRASLEQIRDYTGAGMHSSGWYSVVKKVAVDVLKRFP
jgi:hypothetical protein